MPWFSSKRTGSSASSSSHAETMTLPTNTTRPRRGMGFIFSRGEKKQKPRLTRQGKLRHLTDQDIGHLPSEKSAMWESGGGVTSTPVSRSSSKINCGQLPRGSAFLMPQPLPRPEREGKPRPLPSPRGTDGEDANGNGEGDAGGPRASSASSSETRPVYPTTRRTTDHLIVPQRGSSPGHTMNESHDSSMTENSYLKQNLPERNAAKYALAPGKVSVGDIFPSPYASYQAPQIWSAPEITTSDIMTSLAGHSPQNSVEKFLASPEQIHSYSPAKSPGIKSKDPCAPLPILQPKLFPDGSPVRHDSNGNINVHPLPLPPGAPVFPPSPSSHQTQKMHPQSPSSHQTQKIDASSTTSQWQKGKLIGSGTFASVYIATNRHTGALCAMKEVNLIPDDPKSVECIKQLQQEIKLLSQLRHQNIVQYYGSKMIDDRFYIYLEYVYPGSINKYVREHCGAITESVVRNFTRHILRGLAYLHSKKTIHRDIKGANLLVNSCGVIKLADFGMAKHLSGAKDALSMKGTPYWMAPEILQATMTKEVNYDFAVDIWSLGCTIIEMFTGKHPWCGFESAAAMFKALHGSPDIPETLSSEGKDFLQLCFRRNPAERPSASQLLEHPFALPCHRDFHVSLQAFQGLNLSDCSHGPWNNNNINL